MPTTLQHPASLSTAWSTGTTIASGLRFQRPTLAVANGQAHAVWQADNAIVHSQREGETWRAPARICGGAQPHAGQDGAGRLHVLFSNDFSGRYDIYHCTWNGRYWSLPLNISMTPGSSWRAQLAIDSSGREHAVWEDHSPGYPMIYYGWRRLGWRWQGSALPHAAGRRPAAVFGPDDGLHVAYQTGDDGLQSGDIYYTMHKGGGWTSPQLISSGDHPAGNVRLAVDGEGRVHAIWRERRPDAEVILYASGRPQEWIAPQEISPVLSHGGAPDLTIARGRFLHGVWPYTEIVEQAQRDLQAPQWEAVELAAAENYSIGELTLVADEAGALHAAWLSHKPQEQCELRYAVREPLLPHQTFLPRL